MKKVDFKTAEKKLYQPPATPGVIEVPTLRFLMVDGKGNPNEPGGSYQTAVELLYTLAYSIKMMPKNSHTPQGYFDYVVPPLEGLWWLLDQKEFDYKDKSKFCWTAMLRQPEFVTEAVLGEAVQLAQRKKPQLPFSLVRLSDVSEGLCVQCMHLGPYDDEPGTLERMNAFITENGLVLDLSDTRRHHEIYLSDPRKTAPEKMRTVLRQPVRRPL